jgi:hypothetical protein
VINVSQPRKLISKMFDLTLGRTLSTLYNARAYAALTASDRYLIGELRSECKRASDSAGNLADRPVGPSWTVNHRRLEDLVLGANPKHFLMWDVIQRTMFCRNEAYIRSELKTLKGRVSWAALWSRVIQESYVGNPPRLYYYPISSGNLVHHAYHVSFYEQVTRKRPWEHQWIFEFGGGYGSMSRVFFELGFRGKYIVFDLPIFSALQRFYLSSLGLPVRGMNDLQGSAEGIFICSSISQFTNAMKSAAPGQSLFVATWSLSESPLEIRMMLEEQIDRCESKLIAFQSHFEGENNVEYFSRRIMTGRLTTEARIVPIKHIAGSFYLVA